MSTSQYRFACLEFYRKINLEHYLLYIFRLQHKVRVSLVQEINELIKGLFFFDEKLHFLSGMGFDLVDHRVKRDEFYVIIYHSYRTYLARAFL